MRRLACTIALILAATATTAFADDCTKDVLAAFEKQRTSKAFRVQMTEPTAEGPAQMTIDYMPPDRMLQTVITPAMPGEQQTMLVGNRAYAGTSGQFEELLPQFTQSIVAEVQTAVGKPPANIGSYECLGKVKFENRDLLAYRQANKSGEIADPNKAIARTVYVEPQSGLPAFNVVAPVSGGEPIMKAAYSYPAEIEIVAPKNAPVQKVH